MDDYNSNSWSHQWSNKPAEDRMCDWPDCDGHGEHRAPKDRDNLRNYFWFCLEHVRDYNKSWNYFDGMETDEFAAMTWSAAKWDRPTWPMGTTGTSGMNAAHQASHIRAASQAFREVPTPGEVSLREYVEAKNSRQLPPDVRKALNVLGLNSTATLQDVKKRFKQLVKRFHPDANGGATSQATESEKAQEQLRGIIAAYSHLVKSNHLTNST
jgi:hypothetical protein